jgi:hypothetical protein
MRRKLPLIPILMPLLLFTAVAFSGCLSVAPQPPLPSTTMSSWSPYGGFSMASGVTCAGHALLTGGGASVNDPCFTGDDNIVMCTDTTSPSAVRCAPGAGVLNLQGTPGDTIAYARVR